MNAFCVFDLCNVIISHADRKQLGKPHSCNCIVVQPCSVTVALYCEGTMECK